MDLKNLRSFAFVAETSSFSIAASRCYVTQSAISQHIKALEDELNCKLLIRSSHSITLTESGKALLVHVKEILKQIEDCKEHINAINNCMIGELRLGIGSFIAPYIRKAAVTFMERYPNVRLNVEFGKACRLNQMLREHKIDMAFTMNTAYDNEGIESEPCIPFTISVIMSDTHPLTKKPKVSFDELMKHSIIMPDVGERIFNTFQKYLTHDLAKLNVKSIVNSADEALAVVRDSNILTFMPKIYVKNYPDIVARPIIGLEQQLMSNAHWMQDVPMKRSAQLFLDIVKEEAVPYITAIQEHL
jgi:LysR family cyn operon transcriptional activator